MMKPQQNIKNILIRLPNWLGDMVMATSCLQMIVDAYPGADIDLIIKKELLFLAERLPAHRRTFLFSKSEHKGLAGAYKFGRSLRSQQQYDLFYCLPESLSSAVMAAATGARFRIGFKKNIHFFFLNNLYKKRNQIHRALEYAGLVQDHLNTKLPAPPVRLYTNSIERKPVIVININSEASSRRLPFAKAVSIVNSMRKAFSEEIILVGGPKEKVFTNDVYNALDSHEGISNLSGLTTLPELTDLLSSCLVMLTTDSGPAHVANAAGTPVVVLFGAGNENNTAPFNDYKRTVIRLGKLSCEPCMDNVCKRFGTPQCLQQLDEDVIVNAVKDLIKQ